MNKVIFVVPYFGSFPPYFSIWLKTVEANPTIDFLLITDYKFNDPLPPNVMALYWSFEELQNFFQSKFEFKICLDKPYKLCDFRPSFGYIFCDYIKDYDFWGNCDIDCVFGDLRKFLNPLMRMYDVIGKYGHLSLYRNRADINRCFEKEGALYPYQEVFSNPENYAFDEVTGIRRIFKLQGINCLFELDSMADIMKMHKSFYIGHGIKNYKKQVFIWEKGKVLQCYYDKKNLYYKEFMYLHFQKKIPLPTAAIKKGFYIFYDVFLPRNGSGSDKKMLEYYSNYRYFIVRMAEKFSWIFKRLFQLMCEEKKQRKIYIYKRKFQ